MTINSDVVFTWVINFFSFFSAFLHQHQCIVYIDHGIMEEIKTISSGLIFD